MQLLGVQFDIAWEDRRANFEKVEQLLAIARPKRGGIVVLPEMFASGFSMNLKASADESGESEAFLAALARRFGVYIIAGVASVGADSRGRNEALVIGGGGNIVARYVKIHPFAPGAEAEHYVGGNEVMTFRCWAARPDSPDGFTVAPFVCYDLRFPEIFRVAMRRGAHVMAVIANWPSSRIEHWTTLLKARAIENQAYVIGVNRCGRDPKLAYPGRSIIVDYRGNVLAEAGDGAEAIAAEIEMEPLLKYRRELPFLDDIKSAFLPPMGQG